MTTTRFTMSKSPSRDTEYRLTRTVDGEGSAVDVTPGELRELVGYLTDPDLGVLADDDVRAYPEGERVIYVETTGE